jgi:nitrate/nitrite-specific signal transduction histidine kinase
MDKDEARMNKQSAIRILQCAFRRGSLCTKIIAWSFVPTAIILVAVALLTFTAYQRVTEDLVIERNRELARLSAGQLATELTEYIDLLEAEARTMGAYGGHPATQRIILQRARERLVVFDGGVLILNTFGTVVAAEPDRLGLVGKDWSNRSYFRQIVRSPGPVFSDIVADGPGGVEVIAIAAPISSDQDEFLGVMVGMFRLSATTVGAFYGDIVKLRLGGSGSVYLVDGDGRVIYHSDADRIGEDFFAQTLVQQVLSGQMDAFRTHDLDGRDVVASFAPVPGTTWGLVIEESWAALISPSQGYRQFLLFLLVLGVVVPALVVAVGVRRITRPITELIGAARSVAEGNFGQRITAQTGDEVEELAEQFNLMSAQLRESYANLEQKVTARTRELSILLEVSHNVASTLELEPLLGLILDQLKSVVDYDGASILALDRGELKLLAYRGPIPQEEALELHFPLEKAGANREVIHRKEPVIIPDVRGDTPLARAFQGTAGDQLTTTFGYIRSWMGIPLIVKDRVVGMLSFDYSEPNYYTPQQAELVLAFAAQGAVAIENARLYAETRRRADEIQTLFTVQQAIASPLEWNKVLQLIADEARRLTSTRLSAVFLLEGGELHLSVLSSEDDPGEFVGSQLPLDQSVSGLALQSCQPILVSDVQNDSRVNPDVRQRAGAKSFLVAPLISDSQPIGTILVADKSAGVLGPDDERVLTMLASGAVIQLENARLYQVEQERRRQLEALYRADEELYRHLQLDEVLQALVDVAVDILRADKSSLMVWDAQRKRLVVQAAHGFSPETMAQMSFALGEGVVGRVAISGEPAIVEDTHADPRVVRRITEAEGIRSFMHAPIEIGGQVFGVFNVSHLKPHAFGDEERRLFIALAQRAALAIENAQLYGQAQQVAMMEERQRLARELHDAVTQTLFSSSLIAEVLPRLWERNPDEGKRRLEELRELTRGALAEMRTLLLELRPAALVDAELSDLLRQLAESITGRARLPVAVEVEGECDLPVEVKVALYRIAHEALNNVAKHARASQASVELRYEGGVVELQVSDDGGGFDPKNISPDSLGLGIMRERVEAVGATLRIDSQVGHGTQVKVAWADRLEGILVGNEKSANCFSK